VPFFSHSNYFKFLASDVINRSKEIFSKVLDDVTQPHQEPRLLPVVEEKLYNYFRRLKTRLQYADIEARVYHADKTEDNLKIHCIYRGFNKIEGVFLERKKNPSNADDFLRQ
jgi:hypothetical protein